MVTNGSMKTSEIRRIAEACRRDIPDQDDRAQEILKRTAGQLSPRAAHRLASGLTLAQVSHRLNDAVGDAGYSRYSDSKVCGWEHWPRGKYSKPPAGALVLLAQMYGTTVDQLLTVEEEEQYSLLDQKMLRSPDSHPIARKPNVVLSLDEDDSGSDSIERIADTSLRLIRDHLQRSTPVTLPGSLMTDMEEEVRRLVRDHAFIGSATTAPRTMAQLTLVLQMLEGGPHPRQVIDLYKAGAILTALMADACASAGLHEQSLRHARYAEDLALSAGYNPIRRWSRGTMMASIEGREKRPAKALALVRDASGLAEGSGANPQLLNAEGIHLARMGQTDAARQKVRQAIECPDYDDELSTEFGGAFAYPVSKRMQIASVTLNVIGDHEHALVTAEHALHSYSSVPEMERPSGNVTAARIELMVAQLHTGRMSEAEQSLNDLLSTPALATTRHHWWLMRLQEVAHQPSFGMAGRSTEIGEFLNDSKLILGTTARQLKAS
jgi:hypothetical protein